MSHPNRNWKRRWVVNLAEQQARHECGLVMTFERPPGAAVNEQEVFEKLAAEDGGQHAGARLARLLDEGRKIYGQTIERQAPGAAQSRPGAGSQAEG